MIDTAALLSATDLPGLIAGSIKLRRMSAGRHVGLCPFHNEKTGSFLVYAATAGDPGHYHCHGCGAHGDAIRWLCDHDRLTFKEACAELARMAGLDKTPTGRAKPRPPKEKPQLPLTGPRRPDLTPETPAVVVPSRHLIGETLALFPRSQIYAGGPDCYLRPLHGRDTLLWCGWRMDRSRPEMRALYGWAIGLHVAALPWAKRVRIGFGWHPLGPVLFDPDHASQIWLGITAEQIAIEGAICAALPASPTPRPAAEVAAPSREPAGEHRGETRDAAA